MAIENINKPPEVFQIMSRLPSRRPKYMGAKLKLIRENWSTPAIQEEFALLVKQCLLLEFAHDYPELNREYISGYERGTRTVPPVVLLAYAHLANVFFEVLMDDRLSFDVNPKFPLTSKFKGIKNSD